MKELKIPVPIHVLKGEAIDVAKFFDTYVHTVKPQKNGTGGRVGLDSIFDKNKSFTAETGDDIRSLERALHEADTAYRQSFSPTAVAPWDRAVHIIDELSAVLEWYFDDGVEDEKDAQLAAVKKAHKETPDSADALASECEDYAALARPHRAKLAGLGGFDAALIDEADTVAAQLREHPTTPAVNAATQDALTLRNQIANLLYARMSLVRAGARFVYRNEPSIVREATSAYERRRRAANRRAAANKPVDPPK